MAKATFINPSIKRKIEVAINSNPLCSGNILLPHRVFARLHGGNERELLVSLNNKSSKPHYWCHVFAKDNLYFATIVAIDRWLNASSIEDLFDLFWYQLGVIGNWYPIGGDVFSVENSFELAVDKLVSMIKNFNPHKALSNCDWRLVQIYPFPNPFEEKVDFETWKAQKDVEHKK